MPQQLLRDFGCCNILWWSSLLRVQQSSLIASTNTNHVVWHGSVGPYSVCLETEELPLAKRGKQSKRHPPTPPVRKINMNYLHTEVRILSGVQLLISSLTSRSTAHCTAVLRTHTVTQGQITFPYRVLQSQYYTDTQPLMPQTRLIGSTPHAAPPDLCLSCRI